MLLSNRGAYTREVSITREQRELVERFVAYALQSGPDSQELWTHFLVSLTKRLDATGNDSEGLTRKVGIAGYILTALLRNFYQGDADSFYWQAGELRKTVFHLAESLGIHILPVHFY